MAVTTAEELVHAETALDDTRNLRLRRPWTIAVDRAIGSVLEPVASALIVVEVIILSSGVFSRYVLKSALVWTDELATILFLWLAMLGAVIAYRRNEHMRLTALIRSVPPKTARVLEIVSAVIVSIFLPGALASEPSLPDPRGDRHDAGAEYPALVRHLGDRRRSYLDSGLGRPATDRRRSQDRRDRRGRRYRRVGNRVFRTSDLHEFWELQPRSVLRHTRRGVRRHRGADCVFIRHGDAQLSRPYHDRPTEYGRRPHGRGHLEPRAACPSRSSCCSAC